MWLQNLNYGTLWLRIGFSIPPEISRDFSVRTNSVPLSLLIFHERANHGQMSM